MDNKYKTVEDEVGYALFHACRGGRWLMCVLISEYQESAFFRPFMSLISGQFRSVSSMLSRAGVQTYDLRGEG